MSARWSRFCPRCGSRNVVDATQCARCQQELHGLFAPGVRPIVCAACNGDVPPSAIYRPGCGRRLDDQRSSVLPGSSGPVEGLDFRRDVLLRDAIKRTEARGSSGAGCVR